MSHRDNVVACVRRLGRRGGLVFEKDRFTTTTAGLRELEAWLADRQVELVAIEATGVYWKPVLYALESRFAVSLCNARNVRRVPGRKTDLSDAEWLADVAAHGMIRPSFVPPPPIRELRELTRYRRTQIDARAAEIQRLEKVLQDAPIKLTSVASRVLTQSGRAMIEALVAGERDGTRLAELAKGKLRPKIPALTEALTGHFGSHQAVACRRILGHLDFLNESVAALTEQVDARTALFAPIYALLSPVPGRDRLTIDVTIAETGADMSRFPTPGRSRLLGRTVPRQRRIGRQTPPGRHYERQPVAPACADRVRPSRSTDQGKLLRRPVPSDRAPPRPQQGRSRHRPFPDRARLAPAQHRRAVQGSRRRLLQPPPRPAAASAPPRRPARRARIHRHAGGNRSSARIDRLPKPPRFKLGSLPSGRSLPSFANTPRNPPPHFTPD
jgi:transposase